MTDPRTIVLIHGAWVTPRSWSRFRERHEARGYRVLTPAWPFEDRAIEDLRRAPAPELARIGMPDHALDWSERYP